ncbi:RNA 2'-phosphotransferase [Streptomyces cavernicola]|uniref:Probable RNA 2'-phosphotransferase n=1 Tax=Streptomyces cavernicola TaxID=3043613 RepID=A0ABT6S3N1_9ACTN|nr:RNA 2'-phosphotransferase [Streptomyces sp. B-S-A6]MDI3402708.1 RNA 2'-phosphotransferase [Streptomyces sp. B-S-A6]
MNDRPTDGPTERPTDRPTDQPTVRHTDQRTDRRIVKVSKYLSKHLRHEPGRIGLTLDTAGWTEIDALLEAAATHGFPITRDELDEAVATSDKQRFAIDGARIRANQGHSVDVDLDLPAATPTTYLFHGTVAANLAAIRREGLRPMNRHDVHLSPDRETATRVGARRGRPIVLSVDAPAMHADGHTFRLSANGVWLTQAVPPRYLRLPN